MVRSIFLTSPAFVPTLEASAAGQGPEASRLTGTEAHPTKKPADNPRAISRLYQTLRPVGGKMEPLGETRKSQRATAQAFW